MDRNKPGFILFSGSNDRAVLALCRGFSRYHIPFALIGRRNTDLLDRSVYAPHFLSRRTHGKVALEQIVGAVAEARSLYGDRPWVLCPTSEYLNLHLLDLREDLSRHGIELSLCQKDLYHRLTNKATFRDFCASNRLDTPTLYVKDDPATLTLPFVAKPRVNLTATGEILYPHLVLSEHDRRELLGRHRMDDYYFEEFVIGESWYLLYYVGRNGAFVTGVQRNILQQGRGKSIVLASSSKAFDPTVVAKYGNALASTGYAGWLMVEIKRTSEDRFVAIEANPRCWGPLQLTLDAGMGLFEAFLNDHGYELPLPEPTSRKYLWSGGVVQALRSGKGLARHASRHEVLMALLAALPNDVYMRKDSISCLMDDLCAG